MKRFNDSIHGLIDVPRYSLIFIDTPVFQRLRNLQQSGVASWVYPTAVHHRFEHSLGTGHLARLLMHHLKDDENLRYKITDADIKCAELAGLLHDIGHGPFSHVWENRVVSSFGIKFTHERASIEIIDWMIETYKLMPELETEGLTKDHIRIIKEMIYGVLPGETEKYYKKTEFKAFMYEIISNGFCELDVDKFDYLARDGKMLGTFSLESATDLQRLIRMTTVVQDSDGCYHLAWRYVAAMTVVNVFQVRHRLHRVAYKHRNTIALELMVGDAIRKANDVFHFTDSYEKTETGDWKLIIPKFLCLTDHIFWQILFSTQEELQESRSIIERMIKRQMYASVAKVNVETKSEQNTGVIRDPRTDEATIREIIIKMKDDDFDEALIEKTKQAMAITYCLFDFCMKEKNPIDKCLFVNRNGGIVKDNDSVIVLYRISPELYSFQQGAHQGLFKSSITLPRHTYALEIRLYSRDRSNDVKACLLMAFKQFCEQEKFGRGPTEM